MKTIVNISLFMALIFSSIHCKKDPAPESGFGDPLYTSFEFAGEHYSWETDSEEVLYSWVPNESGHAILNDFSMGSEGSLAVSIHFGGELEKSSITNLENTIVNAGPGKGFPYLTIYWEKDGIEAYTNAVDEIDYGVGQFEITEVFKSKRIDYTEALTGDPGKGRSYVLRGNFDINVSKPSWSPNEPVEFFSLSGGKFSIRVFHP